MNDDGAPNTGPDQPSEKNEDAVVRLLFRERIRILAYIRSIVMDESLAEDIFQNTAVAAMKKIGQLRDEDGFIPWVRTIARYEALNALRRRSRHAFSLDNSTLDLLDETWSRQDDESTSEWYAEGLRDCVQRLTPRARRFVHLRYSEGKTGELLAASMDCTLNTAYVTLSRIHKQLRECVLRYLQRVQHES